MNERKFYLFYTLDGHTPVPEPDGVAFVRWFKTADRRVDLTRIDGEREVVSTVFLAINQRFVFTTRLPPILFETMVIGGNFDGCRKRTSTWEEAEAAHQNMVKMVLSGRVGIDE